MPSKAREAALAMLTKAEDTRAKGYAMLEKADEMKAEGWAMLQEAERQEMLDRCRSQCGRCKKRPAAWLASSSPKSERWPVCDPCKDGLIGERKPQTIYFESVAQILELKAR
jgi:hypothetical protein